MMLFEVIAEGKNLWVVRVVSDGGRDRKIIHKGL